jgi:hypothetical protein
LRKYTLPVFSQDVIAGIEDVKRSPVLEVDGTERVALPPRPEAVVVTPTEKIEGAIAVS